MRGPSNPIHLVAAGALGIVAMEAVSYADMLLRGRPASDQPARLGEALAARLGIWQGDTEADRARRSALGSLAGYPDGLLLPALAAAVGLRRTGLARHAGVLAAGATIGSSLLPVALRVTDPRRWSLADWATDAVPHLAYGITAALASRPSRRAAVHSEAVRRV